MTEDEVEYYGSLEGWPGSVGQLLEEEQARVSLLSFSWDGFGPMSSGAGLVLVGAGKRRHLCAWDEISSYRALAAVEPWDEPGAVATVVADYVACNGRKYGDWIFGSLPTEVTNRRPDLLPTPVVRQALFDFMQWSERAEAGAWGALAAEVYGKIVEPNHLERSLDVLQAVVDVGIDAWLAELERESAEMPDHERQRVFDYWFASAYSVQRQRA